MAHIIPIHTSPNFVLRFVTPNSQTIEENVSIYQGHVGDLVEFEGEVTQIVSLQPFSTQSSTVNANLDKAKLYGVQLFPVGKDIVKSFYPIVRGDTIVYEEDEVYKANQVKKAKLVDTNTWWVQFEDDVWFDGKIWLKAVPLVMWDNQNWSTLPPNVWWFSSHTTYIEYGGTIYTWDKTWTDKFVPLTSNSVHKWSDVQSGKFAPTVNTSWILEGEHNVGNTIPFPPIQAHLSLTVDNWSSEVVFLSVNGEVLLLDPHSSKLVVWKQKEQDIKIWATSPSHSKIYLEFGPLSFVEPQSLRMWTSGEGLKVSLPVLL